MVDSHFNACNERYIFVYLGSYMVNNALFQGVFSLFMEFKNYLDSQRIRFDEAAIEKLPGSFSTVLKFIHPLNLLLTIQIKML